jgi:hypothetical protein
LLPMDTAGHDHQQKCEKRRYGTHFESLPQVLAE